MLHLHAICLYLYTECCKRHIGIPFHHLDQDTLLNDNAPFVRNQFPIASVFRRWRRSNFERHFGKRHKIEKCSEEDNDNNSSALRRKELSSIFIPVLRFIKIGGQCYGDLFLDEFELHRGIFSRIYCAVVVLGQWFVAMEAVSSLFCEGLAHLTKFFLLNDLDELVSAVGSGNDNMSSFFPKGRENHHVLGILLITFSNNHPA